MNQVTKQSQTNIRTKDVMIDWVRAWAFTLAYAMTQSLDEAERVLAETIAQLTVQKNQINTEALALQRIEFARVLFRVANPRAFRGFGADRFFRMPFVTRTVIILKTHGQFSREQIARVVGIAPNQVDWHLETAQLIFSNGQSWVTVQAYNHFNIYGINNKSDLHSLLAQYCESELTPKSTQTVQAHLMNCEVCLDGFQKFKTRYVEWKRAQPYVELPTHTIEAFSQLSDKALKLSRRRERAPMALFVAGVKKMFAQAQVQLLLMAVVMYLAIQYILLPKIK